MCKFKKTLLQCALFASLLISAPLGAISSSNGTGVEGADRNTPTTEPKTTVTQPREDQTMTTGGLSLGVYWRRPFYYRPYFSPFYRYYYPYRPYYYNYYYYPYRPYYYQYRW